MGTLTPFLLADASAPGSLDALHYGLIIGGGVVLAGAVLVLLLVRRRASLPPRSSRPVPSAPARGEPEVERLRVDLQSLAREVEGRLDTKMNCLKRLIGEADEAAKRLEALRDGPDALVVGRVSAEEAPESHQEGTGDGREALEVHDSGSPESEAVRSRVLELFNAGRKAEEIAEEVGLPKGEVELVINLFQTERSR